MELSIGNDDSLESNGIYLLMEEITSSSVKGVIDWILRNECSEEPEATLTLIICSEGGDAAAAFALIDVMKGAHYPVGTLGIGEISSAGLMIFMAGEKGRRVVTPNTSIMSHQYASITGGKHHELLASRKGFDLFQALIMRHYIQCTNLTEKAIKKFLLPPEDVHLSAEEALQLGLCDEIRGD